VANPGAHFVLVHGAWHGAWCWEKIVPLLEASGATVEAVDLPGRDGNATAAVTLDDCVAVVRERVEAARRPVVLVGHSMGGLTVTQVAELVPERIARLVYVCAFVPGNGQTLGDLAALAEFQPSLAARYQSLDFEAGVYTMPVEHARDVLFGTCTAHAAAAAARRLGPESLAIGAQAISVTPNGFGSVRRAYVEALQDAAIPIAAQRAMHRAGGCDKVVALDSDHSPFLSRPAELAEALHRLAEPVTAPVNEVRG
jgi:pimeloyl-ACP methyl ester carboxylesterase